MVNEYIFKIEYGVKEEHWCLVRAKSLHQAIVRVRREYPEPGYDIQWMRETKKEDVSQDLQVF